MLLHSENENYYNLLQLTTPEIGTPHLNSFS